MVKFEGIERILKAPREKHEVTHRGTLISLAADFSMETLKPAGNGNKYSNK